MQDVDELRLGHHHNGQQHHRSSRQDEDAGGIEGGEESSNNNTNKKLKLWEPSGNCIQDFLYFSGPGWFVSIAYVDPGNYQADIQAGSTSRYSLLFALWWTAILSIYVQVLCVRLAFYSNLTLSQVRAKTHPSRSSRYFNWAIAEFSTIITDLPTVIGFAIAINYFFGLPYWVGVLMSLVTTMIFLASLSYGMRLLEIAIFVFVAIMSIALWVEMSYVNPNYREMIKGWTIGFVETSTSDIFSLAGILGSVVMPHNLYLHTAAVQSKRQYIQPSSSVIAKAVQYCSIEPIIPILVSFFVNMAVVTIAAERVYGSEDADSVGLTNFCLFFQSLKGGCLLWATALLAAGQSGAITTTYTGQYIMDGYLNIRVSPWIRSIVTRLTAITPAVIIAATFPDKLNQLVNVVNALLGLLLPFAFSPLVKYNCSARIMGPDNASKGFEKMILYMFAMIVWAVNATTISVKGGGFYGEIIPTTAAQQFVVIVLQLVTQIWYAWWNFSTLFETEIIDIYDSIDDDASRKEEEPPSLSMLSTNNSNLHEAFSIDDDDDDDDDFELT
jgi:NRAMP (natural resistance-associated macrophage protein)-like metal ion transporter